MLRCENVNEIFFLLFHNFPPKSRKLFRSIRRSSRKCDDTCNSTENEQQNDNWNSISKLNFPNEKLMTEAEEFSWIIPTIFQCSKAVSIWWFRSGTKVKKKSTSTRIVREISDQTERKSFAATQSQYVESKFESTVSDFLVPVADSHTINQWNWEADKWVVNDRQQFISDDNATLEDIQGADSGWILRDREDNRQGKLCRCQIGPSSCHKKWGKISLFLHSNISHLPTDGSIRVTREKKKHVQKTESRKSRWKFGGIFSPPTQARWRRPAGSESEARQRCRFGWEIREKKIPSVEFHFSFLAPRQLEMKILGKWFNLTPSCVRPEENDGKVEDFAIPFIRCFRGAAVGNKK